MSTDSYGAMLATPRRPFNGRQAAAALTSLLWAAATFKITAADAERGAWPAVACIVLAPAVLWLLMAIRHKAPSHLSALEVEAMCWESANGSEERLSTASEAPQQPHSTRLTDSRSRHGSGHRSDTTTENSPGSPHVLARFPANKPRSA